MSVKEGVEQKRSLFDRLTQVLLPTLTATGFLLTSLKMPQWGLAINLVAQIFWFYASWKAWREAGQIGVFITTVIIFIIVLFGVLNYWVF